MGDDSPKPTAARDHHRGGAQVPEPRVAELTIFGTIAREMRKYNVTLLVVDQRPSEIDDEIMSQIGTRITCLLDNERDTAAVLGGIPGASGLRSVLAQARDQAAGAHPRPRRADAGGDPHARLRHREVLRRARGRKE